MKKKYVVVTGGVISGIGKGILSASIARVMKECGVEVNTLKIDPYPKTDTKPISTSVITRGFSGRT